MRKLIWITLLLPTMLLTCVCFGCYGCGSQRVITTARTAESVADDWSKVEDENSCRDEHCWPVFTVGGFTGCITTKALKEAEPLSDYCEKKTDTKGNDYLWCGDEDGEYWAKHEYWLAHPTCGSVDCRMN